MEAREARVHDHGHSLCVGRDHLPRRNSIGTYFAGKQKKQPDKFGSTFGLTLTRLIILLIQEITMHPARFRLIFHSRNSYSRTR
jgi:hypothetical protein